MDAKVGKPVDPLGETHPRPLSPALLGDLLRVLDLGVIVSIGLGIYFAYVFPGAPETLERYLMVLLIVGVVAGLIFQRFGVYGGDYLFANRLRLDRMISAWAMTVTALLVIAFTLKISDQISRVWAVSWFCCSAGALTLGRLILGRWISGQVSLGRFACRTVIVGTGEQACRLATHLTQNDRIRTQIIGFIQYKEISDRRKVPENEVLGGIDDLISLIRKGSVDQVFVALPSGDLGRIRDTVHRLAETPVAIRLAPDLTTYEYIDRSFSRVAGLPVLRLFDRPISGWSRLCKAIEDRGLAILFLVVLSPLLLLIGFLIKLDSPGPALFKQKRHGFNDQLIEVWKFRTMYSHLGDADTVVQAKKDDLRVTRVGRILRRTSLDELPQLVNVLTGEMSIVGPRPHAPATKAGGRLYYDAVEHYGARHKVKPGITGWAQVNGWRGETDTVGKIRKRVEYDLYYIDHWSVWLDLVIIARTLLVPFKDDQAY